LSCSAVEEEEEEEEEEEDTSNDYMFRFILSHAQAIQDCIKQKNTT
jgi:hypothetical protein